MNWFLAISKLQVSNLPRSEPSVSRVNWRNRCCSLDRAPTPSFLPVWCPYQRAFEKTAHAAYLLNLLHRISNHELLGRYLARPPLFLRPAWFLHLPAMTSITVTPPVSHRLYHCLLRPPVVPWRVTRSGLLLPFLHVHAL